LKNVSICCQHFWSPFFVTFFVENQILRDFHGELCRKIPRKIKCAKNQLKYAHTFPMVLLTNAQWPSRPPQDQ
jgi:hypothetical protein